MNISSLEPKLLTTIEELRAEHHACTLRQLANHLRISETGVRNLCAALRDRGLVTWTKMPGSLRTTRGPVLGGGGGGGAMPVGGAGGGGGYMLTTIVDAGAASPSTAAPRPPAPGSLVAELRDENARLLARLAELTAAPADPDVVESKPKTAKRPPSPPKKATTGAKATRGSRTTRAAAGTAKG